MKIARAVGAIDQGGYRKIAGGETPLLGGLGIALPFLAVCLLGFFPPTDLMASIAKRHQWSLAVLAFGTIGIVGLGVLDDVRGLRARTKLLGQVIVAVIVCATIAPLGRIYIPLVGEIVLSKFSGYFVGVLWIVGLINAFNFIDGTDGLATSISLIASVALAVLAAIGGHTFIVVICSVLAGSLLAFLAFNFPPARIYLGDTGSMFIGYVLATVTLMDSYKKEAGVIILAPMLALGFPVFEAFVSMLRRYARGVPIFVADDGHTHHRLLSKGYSQRQVVLVLCGAAVVLTGSAIMGRLVPERSPLVWFQVTLYVTPLVVIAWIAGYLHPKHSATALKRRRHNALLSALCRYVILSFGKSGRAAPSEPILECCRRELALKYIEATIENESYPIVLAGAADGVVESMYVNPPNGKRIVVRYQYEHVPSEHERRDATACLARIFENAAIMHLSGDEATDPEPTETE
jgi:UDP-GlcNAc:undecaprenyl-phosphate GlcNAc-1-phosphate transferase